MGRCRTVNHGMPPGLHRKGESYYHVTAATPRKWTPLGKNRARALLEWARIEGTVPDPAVRTFEVIALRYEREVMPTKAPRTQRDNLIELDKLRAVFGRMLIEAIKPHHIRSYLDKRGQTAKARANREKALLSHVFNKAREWGYTDAPNPCQGVKGFTESGRDRYVTDAEFTAVHARADPTLQDAMDIALLTGQRPADVLKIMLADIRDGALFVAQNKTGAKRAIEIVGELADVVGPQARPAKLLPDPGRQRQALEHAGHARPIRQGPEGCGRYVPVPRHPRQNRQRYRRPGALTTAAGAQEPRHDRTLCARAHRPAGEAASLSPRTSRASPAGTRGGALGEEAKRRKPGAPRRPSIKTASGSDVGARAARGRGHRPPKQPSGGRAI